MREVANGRAPGRVTTGVMGPDEGPPGFRRISSISSRESPAPARPRPHSNSSSREWSAASGAFL